MDARSTVEMASFVLVLDIGVLLLYLGRNRRWIHPF